MKKARLVILIAVLAALLIGCADTNVVESVELAAKEKLLVSALSDQTAVLEYRLDGKTYKWLSMWAQRYEYGELKQTIDINTACEVKKGGNIVLSMFREVKDVSPEMLNVFILQDGVISSQFNALPDIADLSAQGRAMQTAIQTQIPESGDVVLMVIHTPGEDGVSPLSQSFLTDYESHIEEISAYENAYIVGCTFSDKLPEGLSLDVVKSS
jgi:hypothetical protein